MIYRVNRKWMAASFNKFYGKMWNGFWHNTEKRLFFQGFCFKATRKDLMFLSKTVLGIYKIALRLRGRHVFMWESLGIWTILILLTWKQVFWKTIKPFLKIWSTVFSSGYYEWKCNISMQSCSLESQGEYKMDITQKMGFFLLLFHFFENLIWI